VTWLMPAFKKPNSWPSSPTTIPRTRERTSHERDTLQ
jgi:hypothetical protein